jgi:hypothetical protein
MCQLNVLHTVDKNGPQHHFVYEPPEEDTVPGETYDEGPRTFTYSIKTKPEDQWFFEFTIQEEGKDRLKVTMMNNHGREEYTGKGTPEEMIVMLARTSGKTVTSSSNRAGPGEYSYYAIPANQYETPVKCGTIPHTAS